MIEHKQVQASRGIPDDLHGHPNVQVPRGTFSFHRTGHPWLGRASLSGAEEWVRV